MSQGQTSQRLRPFKPLRFGRYTLLMPISTGGMGEIFLGRLAGSPGFDELCVIKKILPHLANDQDFVSRFVDEAQILVKLSHENIAQIVDMGVHDTGPYIALEFVDGKDLRRVLSRMRERQLPLPLSFVLCVMTRVLDALAYAHRQRGDDDCELSLVHRDVSPQNVLISYEGEVKVIDFGLAKSALSLSKTNPSIVMGKLMYMAPEQARQKTVDRRSDLYAVGLCLWELITGKNPFEEVPSGELMAKVSSPSIPPLNSIEPLCPQALSDAVARALDPDPSQRFQIAEDFRARLQTILKDIDPQAGAQTTSRFMRDAFAAEYQAERRMLNTVKEQARTLEEPAEQPPPTLSMPAVTMDDETPTHRRLGLQPEALSFQPTRKVPRSASSKKSEVHEQETRPSIQPVRARVLTKSFDDDATEAWTPAIAEPEPLPSVVIDGIPSEPVHTELEMPAQQAAPPARVVKALPKQEAAKKAGTNVKRPRVKAAPVRPGAQVLSPVFETPLPQVLTPKRRTPMIWFLVPLLALAAVGGLIAYDVSSDKAVRQRAAAIDDLPEEPAQPDVGAHPLEPEAPPEVSKAVAAKSGPRKKAKIVQASLSPAQAAMKALHGDFDRLGDEAVQRKYRPQLHALDGQVEERGDDPTFVKNVRALHEQVKTALAKQQ